MSRTLLVSLILGPALLGAVGSHAQVVTDSSVSGTLVSRSATIPAGDSRTVVFDVPDSGHFVLTQACMSSRVWIPSVS